jgi:DNA ligase-1
MQHPILYKLTRNGAINSWQIIIKDDSFYTIEGIVNGQLTTSAPTICVAKNTGRANYRDAHTQASCEAKSKWDAKVSSGYCESIDQVTSAARFEPMLAQTFDKMTPKQQVALKDETIFSQPKLDGIRALAFMNVDGNVLLLSRNGKVLHPNDNIMQDITRVMIQYPSLILDGELFCKDANFNEIVGMVRGGEMEDGLKYHLYDVFDKNNPNAVFKDRFDTLLGLTLPSKTFSIVSTTPVRFSDTAVLDSLEEEYIRLGYEGQMIRLNKSYTQGRSWSLIKRKRFEDDEFEIVQVLEGNGNRSGTVGSIQLKTKNGELFNSNVKLNHVQLAALYTKKDELVGKFATVKYFHLTPAGIPRFPYIIQIDRTSFE